MFWIVWCSGFFGFSTTSAVNNFATGDVVAGWVQVGFAILFLVMLALHLRIQERKRQLELSLARRGVR